jgi:hypothetical protein
MTNARVTRRAHVFPATPYSANPSRSQSRRITIRMENVPYRSNMRLRRANTSGRLPRIHAKYAAEVDAPKTVRARKALRAKSASPADASRRNAINAPAPRMSPLDRDDTPPSATARQSAAPHRNSPKTRIIAGAPCPEVSTAQSAIAKSAAVQSRYGNRARAL